MKMYIYICTRVQRKASIHSSTWKLKQNKCTHKCSKKGNTPRKWRFKSNQSRESTCLPFFALLVTHKEKRRSRMPVNLKKTEFAPAGFQAEVPLAPFTRKRPVQEAKFNLETIPVETQTPTFTWFPKISNTYFSTLEPKRVMHVMAPWWGIP